MDGNHDVLLFLRCVAQQRLHPLFQASVIFDADRECCNDNADNDCPIQEDEEQLERDGITEDEWEQEEVADSDKQYQSENGARLMPDAPRLDARVQRPDDSQPIERITAKRHEPEYGRHQKFIPLIHAKSKRLKEIEYCPNEGSIDDAVSQPAGALLKWICSGK